MTNAPTVLLVACDVRVEAPKPAEATGTGWKVQYFNGTASITTSSSTVKRVATLPPGTHRITAKWTKSGKPTIVSEAVIWSVVSSSEAGPTPQPPVPVNCRVSEWGPWSAWAPISATQEQRSRSREITTAPANGGAACPPLVEVETRTIQTPDESGKRLITPSDFSYLGIARLPENCDLTFSSGALTGRNVNGQTRLFMFGNRNEGDPVYEFSDSGVYHKDLAQAPRMGLVKNWGWIYGDKKKTFNADGSERVIDSTRYMTGLHFSEKTGLLYWTFADMYNTTAEQDWCLGGTKLDAAGPIAYGPWRPSGEGKKGPWRCLRIAEHPITGELLCGSGNMSGNHSSPWGPDLWGGTLPNAATPGGFGAPDIPIQKYVTYYPMFNNINRDGTFNGPLMACRRGEYLFEPILGDSTYPQIDPAKNGGVGSWSELDGLSGNVWIDLPDMHGILFTGKLATEHVWYRNAGQGNDLCTHGMAAPIMVTGPVSTNAYPITFIYNPSDVNAVRAGLKIDYTVDPAYTMNMEQMFGVITAGMRETTAKSLGGAYFDATTRKLYIGAANIDNLSGFLNPIVHVFQLAG